MTNRVFIGKHGTHSWGAFVSKPGVDVTGSDNDFFLFDTTANNVSSHGQVLFWKEVTLTSSAPQATITFKSFTRNCFVQGTLSWGSDAANISCISQSANSTRGSAHYAPFGSVTNNSGVGDDVSFTITTAFAGTAPNMYGAAVVTRIFQGQSDVGEDICVQLMGWKESGT